MRLLDKRTINGVPINAYEDDGDVWITGQSLGEMLGYKHPQRAIENIRSQHEERLSKFSKLVSLDGDSEPTYVYNFKGLLEICRWAHREEANVIFDTVIDLIFGGKNNG